MPQDSHKENEKVRERLQHLTELIGAFLGRIQSAKHLADRLREREKWAYVGLMREEPYIGTAERTYHVSKYLSVLSDVLFLPGAGVGKAIGSILKTAITGVVRTAGTKALATGRTALAAAQLVERELLKNVVNQTVRKNVADIFKKAAQDAGQHLIQTLTSFRAFKALGRDGVFALVAKAGEVTSLTRTLGWPRSDDEWRSEFDASLTRLFTADVTSRSIYKLADLFEKEWGEHENKLDLKGRQGMDELERRKATYALWKRKYDIFQTLYIQAAEAYCQLQNELSAAQREKTNLQSQLR